MQKIGLCLFVLGSFIIVGSLLLASQLAGHAQNAFIGGFVTLGFGCLFTMFGAVGWQATTTQSSSN